MGRRATEVVRIRQHDRTFLKELNGGPVEPRKCVLEKANDPYFLMPTMDEIYRVELFFSGEEISKIRYARPKKEDRERMIKEYDFVRVSERKYVISKEHALELLKKKYPEQMERYKGVYGVIYEIKYS